MATMLSAQGPGLARLVPSVRAIVDPSPNPSGWNNSPVRVEFFCRSIDVRSCPDAIPVQSEGAGQEVAARTLDGAGREVRTVIRVNIDRTPPVVRLVSATPQSNGFAQVVASVYDALSGVTRVACNGVTARIIGGTAAC